MKYPKTKASVTTPAHPPTAPPTILPVFEEAGFGDEVAVSGTAGDELGDGDTETDTV